ncbi:MAG: hypothetical protein SNJ58_06445, partial [Aggregatilineales bacterium]
ADGAPIATLEGHEREVYGALELRDGRLLSWSGDSTLRLWRADEAPIASLAGHENSVWGALELRSGRLLSWSKDGTLRLWGADGAPIARLEGHAGVVLGALELRDGRLLSWSDALRLWGADGAPIAALEQDYHTGDRAHIATWAAQHGCSLADFFPLQEIDPPMLGGRLQLRRNILILYQPETGARLSAFYGDAEFTAGPVVLAGGQVVALGDKAGRVLFLRWQGGG